MSDPRVEYSTVEIEAFKVGLRKALDRYLVEPEVRAYVLDVFQQSIMVEVEGFIWGQKLGTKTIKHPLDWWQAFKERWFPEWLKRKYPVVYQVHRISHTAMFPGFKPGVPVGRSEWVVFSEFDQAILPGQDSNLESPD